MTGRIKTFKSVTIVTAFTILSFIFTTLLQIVLAYLYGAKREMDVYFLALSVPLFLTGIIISTLTVVFIPIFKDFIVKGKEDDLQRFINTATSYLILVLAFITAALFIFAPFIISKATSGLTADNKALAVLLLRILSFSIFPVGLYSLFIIIYYSRESFLKPVFIRFLNPLIVIIAVLIFNHSLGVKSIAYGFVSGCIAQFVLMLSFLREEKAKFRFNFDLLGITGGIKLWKASFIVIAGIFIFGLILPTEKFLASRLSYGSVSYLGYVEQMCSILILFPNMAIPIVIMPQLAGHYAIADISKLRGTFSAGIRSTLFITLPIIAALFVFREPFVRVYLQRGAFNSEAAVYTSMALIFYLGVFFESERLMILNTIYAMKDIIWPVVSGIVTYAFYLPIAIFLSAKMSFLGLAIAHSLACFVYIALNLAILRIKLKFIYGRRIFVSAIKMTASSIVAGGMMWLVFNIASRLINTAGSHFSLSLGLFFSVSTGILFYLGSCSLLRLEEVKHFSRIVVSYGQRISLKKR